MYRGNSSRLFPIILVLIIIAVAIAALVSVGKAIFGGDSQPSDQTDTSRQILLNTTVGNSVRMTVRGPIVAEENFKTNRVAVDSTSRSTTNYSGYLGQVIDSKQFSNNVKAYDEFVHALDYANLVKGVALTGDKDDTRGICASGTVYEFDVLQSGTVVKHLWTSTCKGSSGSFKGSVEQVKTLFLNQIPGKQTL